MTTILTYILACLNACVRDTFYLGVIKCEMRIKIIMNGATAAVARAEVKDNSKKKREATLRRLLKKVPSTET